MRSIKFIVVTFLFNINLFFAQVPVQINSGNPAFPFPQFLEYAQGKTVGKYNPEGVTHCEMESTIREAWQIMANRFRYTGKTAGGVKYIKGNRGCPYDCAEGEGYSMLGAAYMADKTTFDGLWMRVHDDMMANEPRYSDGIITNPNYRYGKHTIKEASGDAAADGDYDIALALLVAYKQWGASSGIVVNNGSGGTKIMSYLEEAKKVVDDLVDTVAIRPLGNPAVIDGWVSGHIGIDGYPKGGNTFKEVTDWANVPTNVPKPSCEVYTGCGAYPGFASYLAPAYFHSFADFSATQGSSAWIINQFKRAEASSEWLMGQVYAQGKLPYLGQYSINGSNAVFGETDPKQGKADGESFRMAWRTILNGLWRGNGVYTWNPITHTFGIGSNTIMKDNADRVANFLRDPGICAALGMTPNPLSNTVKHKGVPQIRQYFLSDGTPGDNNWTNYTLGSSAAAITLHGDEQLAAQIYRQLELKWDDVNPAITGTPDPSTSEAKYFHDWFRHMGMLTLTGNYHAPENIKASANMKVYMSVNKTFAFTGDEITYTVDYRNYGVIDALDTKIVVDIDPQYEVINTGGGVLAGNKLTFTIGTVPGFKTASGILPTKGNRIFKVKVKSPKVTDRVCLTSTISATNDPNTWTSNEYPNNCTYTMERNCVDILQNRALTITKTANRAAVNPGDKVEFKLDFSNSTEAGWLNGGRKYVNFSYGYGQAGPNTYFHTFRNWHNADEAYIDLKNYRASFYMFDEVNKGLQGTPSSTGPCGSGGSCLLSTSGWALTGKNLQTGIEGAASGFKFCAEEVPFGNQGGKKWDQRIIMQFPDEITAPTHMVLTHTNNRFQLHKGTLLPIWYEVKMETVPSSPLFTGRLDDDWSFMGTAFSAGPSGVGSAPYFLIGPNYADPTTTTGLVMDRYDRDACSGFFTPDKIYSKILVEEWDGYTWRRISGEGPLPGREMTDVVVRDTIPSEYEFVQFLDDMADGIKATLETATDGRKIVVWTKCKMLVGTVGDLKYEVKAKGTCPSFTTKDVENVAWISSSTDSPISDNAIVNITCAYVPPPVNATTMTKVADKTSYVIGENIVYTIDFEQTIGSVSVPPLTASNRWTPIDPGLPTFGASAIDFDVPASPGKFLYEKYSHGKNGTLILDVDHDGQENFGLVFRYTSGTRNTTVQGLYLDFQLSYWGNQANITLYQNGVSIGTVVQKAYAAPFTDAKIKVELIDGTMNIWINNISGLPFHTFSGITNLNAGYVGFAQGDKNRSSSIYSKPKITSWDARFDSAFDVSLKDILPAELSYVSSTASGVNTSNTVNWPVIAGPVLNGTKLTYKVTGKVNSCSATGKITNVANLNAFGFPTDNFGAQSVVSCATTLNSKFLNFTTQIQNDGVLLNWDVTVNEKCKKYVILRSFDGNYYEPITEINCHGIKSTSFQYLDKLNDRGVYYKICQVEVNESFTYSKSIYVNVNIQNKINIYPNPVKDALVVQNNSEEDIMFQLLTVNGSIVKSVNIAAGSEITLHVELPVGVYISSIQNSIETTYSKVIKE